MRALSAPLPGVARQGLRWVGLFLAAGLWLGVGPAGAASEQAAAKAAELEELRARIQQAREALQSTRGRHDSVQRELRRVERQIGKVTRALRDLEDEITGQQRALEVLQLRRGELEQGLARHRGVLARQVRASYIMGRQEHLKILLNQGDPATVQRALVYYDYLNRSRAARIHEALDSLRELRTVEAEIRQRQASLRELHARQDRQKERLEAGRAARRDVLAVLDRDIRSKDRKLKVMLRDERELEQVLRALEQALSDIPLPPQADRAFASRKGRLPWPARGRLVHRYGSRRNVGNLRWRGVMIGAPSGRQVRAISYGRVAFADWLRGYGLLLIIDHGDGFMSLYGHNQSLYRDAGEWVEAGDVIASVGDSGGQQDSGLYFEIRAQGEPVDPARWCQAPKGRVVGLNP